MVVPCRSAQASILTRRWAAWHVWGVTVLSSPPILAVTLVTSISVLASSILAWVGVLKALIHIDVAVGAFETLLACATICVL